MNQTGTSLLTIQRPGEIEMSFVSIDGKTKPYLNPTDFYPTFGGRQPVLRGFYLGYDKGHPDPVDHHIANMQVLVGGLSQDLSSANAALNRNELSDGTA
jgi:hypothetical protein